MTAASRRLLWLHPLVMGFCAVLVLLMSARYLWTGGMHVTALGSHLNDQVSYITATRNLVDRGSLESSLYYPAMITYYRSHNVLYMPGSYYIRALFLRLFGYSTLVAFLPSLFSYVVSVVLIFVIVRRMSDVRAAYLTGIFLMLFPPMVLYAFSAMMELLFVCAVLIGFYLFLLLPAGMRHTVGVLAVLLPYLIRESAVLMVPGFAALILMDNDRERVKKALIFLLLSVLSLYLVKRLPVIADIPPHFLVRLIDISALYTDATLLKDVRITTSFLAEVALRNSGQNVKLLLALLGQWPSWRPDFFFFVMVMGLFLVSGCIALRGKLRHRKIALFGALATAGMMTVMASLLYYFVNYNGIRQLLFMSPFLFGAVCMAVADRLSLIPARLAALLVAVVVVVNILFLAGYLNKFNAEFVRADAFARARVAEMDALGMGTKGFIVAPHAISLDYVLERYPIRWSFVPDNEETLRLLAERYPISIMIVPWGHPLVQERAGRGVRDALLGGRFVAQGVRVIMGMPHVVYLPRGK